MNRKPPPKPVLIAAILPFVAAVIGLFVSAHFASSTGMIICIAGLFGYYIIFGIVYAVISLKQDKKRAEEMGNLTSGKYLQLFSNYANAQTEEEEKAAAEMLDLAFQREVEEAASKKLKAGTIVFIIFTIIFVAGAFIAAAFDYTEITFACIGAFVGLVLLVAIIIACSSHVRKNPPKSANKTGEGKCIVCATCIGISVFAGFTKDGNRVMPKYKNSSNFKVVLELNGRRMFAYSHDRYFHGDKVKVAYSDKSDKCYIIKPSA
ncbi:MAG: hypothetical protein HDP34_03805 [Clostridia bacterium]|nr:hypothetical protein [Clostridia bacterium]